MKSQFEKFIKIKFVGGHWYFSPDKNMKVHNVFTNGRCMGFYKSPNIDTGGEFRDWEVSHPEPGCMAFAKFNLYNHQKSLYQEAFVAFIYNRGFLRGKWKTWEPPHDVRVAFERGSADVEIAIMCSNSSVELVSIKSRGDSHKLLTLQHVLDYASGNLSLSDILGLVEAEERLRLHQERQAIYSRLLPLARKLKGAVRSSTGAEIEKLVMELLEGKFPF